MYVYDYLFACKCLPFFPFEMSHKKRRESTKTPGEEITGFLFFETTRKNSAFLRYTIYIACI